MLRVILANITVQISALLHTYIQLRRVFRKMAPCLNKVHDKNALKL